MQGPEYIATDGGSNQEESCYLGKPYLVLRKETERQEGLGENVSTAMLIRMHAIQHYVNTCQRLFSCLTEATVGVEQERYLQIPQKESALQ